MSIFEFVILDIIYILFPLGIYLFYLMNVTNINKQENNLFLGLAICSSYYLSIKFGKEFFYGSTFLILNAPLAIAYLKERNFEIFLLSILTCVYYYVLTDIPVWFFLVEYFLYYSIYYFIKYIKKEDKKEVFFSIFFLIMKGIFSFLLVVVSGPQLGGYELLHLLLSNILFALIIYLVLIIFKKSEEIVKLHINLQEMQREEKFRDSLFKITHEIKNPIAVCKGYIDMFDIYNIQKSQKYISIMKEEISRTLTLLEDFSNCHKQTLHKDIIDLHMLLEDCSDNLKNLLISKNIDYRLNISQDEVFIQADYNRLTQVIINIIKNGIEAMDEKLDHKITVSTEFKKDKVLVYFKDNGSGIPEDILKQIKEPFFTTKSKGTGLGVSISYDIVEAHGGNLEYVSKLGEGTTVIMSLPKLEEMGKI